MDKTKVLKAIASETRMKIVVLLLKHNYCVRALATELSLTEACVSQHLKVLREAGLLIGEKRGYFMHYKVDRSMLHKLAGEIEALAAIEQEPCEPSSHPDCSANEKSEYHAKGRCSEEVQEFCHGKQTNSKIGGRCHHG